MAFIFTYNSLKEVIPQYLERTDADLLDKIPLFIDLAQEEISTQLKQLSTTTYLNGSFTVGQGVLQKPANWLNVLNFNFGTGTGNNTINNLELRTYEFCNEYWKDRTLTGTPKYYCDYGFQNWLVVPIPDAEYPFEISFLRRLDTLSDSQQTNYLTDFQPDLLLYACLVQANLYLKNFDKADVWKQKYLEKLNALMMEDAARASDQMQTRKEA